MSVLLRFLLYIYSDIFKHTLHLQEFEEAVSWMLERSGRHCVVKIAVVVCTDSLKKIVIQVNVPLNDNHRAYY